ncbi:hypothetical protein BGW39_001311, partial [Mortierella sp. 14UC]
MAAQIQTLTTMVTQLKTQAPSDAKPLVYKKPRPTYIVPTQHLLNIYPAIEVQNNFFKAKLDPDDKILDMSDYHYLEGMDYEAYQLIDVQQKGIQLSNDNSFAEKELARIQTRLAHLTRPLDTLAHFASQDDTENIWKDRAVALANTIRYLAGDIAAQANESRQNILYRQMGLGDPTPKPAAVTLHEIVERKAALDIINSAFPVKKKQQHKPSSKDGDKQQDKTKSSDTSKDKPKQQKDKGSGNNNGNNNNSTKKGSSGNNGRKPDSSNNSG